MGLPKAQPPQWVNHIAGFFDRLNFMNDQHLRNLRSLRTLKKTNYTAPIQTFIHVIGCMMLHILANCSISISSIECEAHLIYIYSFTLKARAACMLYHRVTYV